jgi:subtilase family serine protease
LYTISAQDASKMSSIQAMDSKAFRNWWLPFGLICLLGVYSATAMGAPPERIHGNIGGGGVYTVPGNVHSIPAAAQDTGAADPSLVLPRITMHLAMTSAQQADLKTLLQAQQTRGDSQYHKWLTPEQFADRFGLNESDIQKLSAWLEDQGFSDIEVARSRTAISFSGTAAQVETSFGTTLHQFNVNGTTHYANLTGPVLPAALKGIVEGIRGLNNFHPKPHLLRRRAALQPHFSSSITGNTFLSPGDFATIYDVNPIYNSGLDGTGQTIAVTGQSDIALTDIENFRTAAGLPPNDPQVILNGPDPGTVSGDESEADLDLEWSGAIAKNAHIIYVNSGTQGGAFDSVTYAIDNNLAGVLVITYGACESSIGTASVNSINGELEQANAQGMTVVAASGDDGAADCDEGPANGNPPASASQGLAVDFPASSPYVTGTYWKTGTTDIISSAISYIPEIVWNDTTEDGYLAASGGGASAIFSKPTWQVGTGVPNDGARDVPDIAFTASPDHDGYLVCSGDGASGNSSVPDCTAGFRDADQDLDVIGGTSATVPVFAALVALLNQQTNSLQGNVDPNLYQIASVSTNAFHDITQGNNIVPCQQGTPNCPVSGQMGFSAGPGYDQTTGLGSIDAYNLFQQWSSNFALSITPTTLSVNPGASATATVDVTPSGGFSSSVSFACSVSGGLANTTCSIPGTVPGSGTATLTITAASTAAAPGSFRWRGFSGGAEIEIFAAAAGLGLFLFLLWPRKRARLTAIALAGLSLATVSCGSGSPSSSTSSMSLQSTAESGTVTVTATSGALSHTATLSVTVQ